jgi:RAT1-interacting protein
MLVDCFFFNFLQKIVVGFRSNVGRVTAVQSFKTLEIPRLVRGKPNAWDPLLCLAWGDRFLNVPGQGASIRGLNEDEVKAVEGGEDRIGFLPRWYWNEVERGRS